MSQSQRILVVDDEAQIARVLRRSLAAFGASLSPRRYPMRESPPCVLHARALTLHAAPLRAPARARPMAPIPDSGT